MGVEMFSEGKKNSGPLPQNKTQKLKFFAVLSWTCEILFAFPLCAVYTWCICMKCHVHLMHLYEVKGVVQHQVVEYLFSSVWSICPPLVLQKLSPPSYFTPPPGHTLSELSWAMNIIGSLIGVDPFNYIRIDVIGKYLCLCLGCYVSLCSTFDVVLV